MRLRVLVVLGLVAAMTSFATEPVAGASKAGAGRNGLHRLAARSAPARSGSYPPNCGPTASSNWAGNEACYSRGTFTTASVEFTIPRTSTSGTVSFWVGVGGGPYTPGGRLLVQAGVTLRYGDAPYAWWEIISNGTYNVGPVTVCNPLHINDTIFVEVESNFDGDQANTITIIDETDPSKCTYDKNEAGTAISDGATAECIVEFPKGPPGSDFGSIKFDQCDPGTNGGASGIGTFPHYYTEIYDGSCLNVSVGPIDVDSGKYDAYRDYYHTC